MKKMKNILMNTLTMKTINIIGTVKKIKIGSQRKKEARLYYLAKNKKDTEDIIKDLEYRIEKKQERNCKNRRYNKIFNGVKMKKELAELEKEIDCFKEN